MGKTLKLPLYRLTPSKVAPSFILTNHTLSLSLASKRYAIKQGDYCCTFSDDLSGTQVAIAEIQGDRKEQQDFITASLVNEKIRNLSTAEFCKAHKKTMDEMQQEYGRVKYSGSTGCVATAWINEYLDVEEDKEEVERTLNIVTANLGDSSAYVIILDEKNDIVPCGKIRLNTWHKPTNPQEKERIYRMGGTVEGGRLNSALNLSRAFGDIHHRGISHESDVLHHQISLKEGQQAFVVVACDGLDTLSPEKISEIVKKNSGQLVKIASQLVDHAMQASLAESSDNISAAVIPVTTTPASAAVFDGHGESDRVANNIGKCFYPRLNKNIEIAYNCKENARTLKDCLNNYSGIPGKVTLTPQIDNLGNCSVLFKTDKNCYSLLKKIQKLAKKHLLSLRDSGLTADDFKITVNQEQNYYSLVVKFPPRDLWYAQFSDFLTETAEYIEVMKDYFKYKSYLEKTLAELNDPTMATNLRDLLREVHKNSASDYHTALNILESHFKIFTDYSEKNIKDYLNLAQDLHTNDVAHCAKWNKAAALMAIIGGALLVATSIIVAVGTCGVGSVPAILGLTAGTCLLLGAFGFFKRESKIPKLMTESVSLKQGPG